MKQMSLDAFIAGFLMCLTVMSIVSKNKENLKSKAIFSQVLIQCADKRCDCLALCAGQSHARHISMLKKTYAASDAYVALHGAASPIRDYQPCRGYRIPTCTL